MSPSQKVGLLNPQLSALQVRQQVDQKMATVTPENKTDVIADLSEALDLFLQGELDTVRDVEKYEALTQSLAKLLGPRGQGNMVMAQINPTPGDLEGNAKKVMAYIDMAEKIGADTVVFPELTLMGYPIHDVIKRHPFIVDENVKWLKEIAKRTGKTRAIVGFVEPRKVPPGQVLVGKPFHNAAAVLGEGKIEKIVRKVLLPTYGEFNDGRYNEPSVASGAHPPETLGDGNWGVTNQPKNGEPVVIHGKKYGIFICEDAWNLKGFAKESELYRRDPTGELAAHNPDVLVNISASPSRARKEKLKNNLLTHAVDTCKIPYVYVNQVGYIDESSFDGGSRVYAPNAKPGESRLTARSKSFREQFQVVNPLQAKAGKIYALPKGLEESLKTPPSRTFDVHDTSDLGRMHESLLQGIRDYFKKTGHTKAVLGLSGGLDSTINAYLLAEALGPENVIGISLPSKITSRESKSDARILAENLGIHFYETPIIGMVTAAMVALKPLFGLIDKAWGKTPWETTTMDNLQARARAVILWAVSNQYPKTLSIATSDKSEAYMGYATVNGDMSGGFAPILDVMKTQLFAMGHWMNQYGAFPNAIPLAVLEKRPGAELKSVALKGLLPNIAGWANTVLPPALQFNVGKAETVKAEDDLMPYPFLDEVIHRIENMGQSYQEMLIDPFQYEREMKGTPQDVSADQKKIWLDRFFKRMSFALFKWTLVPPTVIVNGGGSITKSDFRQSITTSRIVYQGHTPEQMGKALQNAPSQSA